MTPTPLAGSVAPHLPYLVRDFSHLRGLKSIPDWMIRSHLLHYEDGVRRLDRLHQRLEETDGNPAREPGMRQRMQRALQDLQLHELYFENLTPGSSAVSRRFATELRIAWGSFRAWQDEFRAMGQPDDVGWVILHMDPVEHQLSNDWVGLHDAGHPSGFIPLLVMDVQDHACAGGQRSATIKAFLENIDWTCVENRHANP